MIQQDTATLSEFATLAGFKRPYITQLKKDGRLVLTEDGRLVRVAESLARLEATRDPSKAGVAARHARARAAAMEPVVPPQAPAEELASDDIGGYQGSRALRERYLAMAAKRDYEISIGKLLNADDAASALDAAATTLRTRFEGFAPVLAPQLAALDDEAAISAIIAEAVEHALEESSRQFLAIAKGGVA